MSGVTQRGDAAGSLLIQAEEDGCSFHRGTRTLFGVSFGLCAQ